MQIPITIWWWDEHWAGLSRAGCSSKLGAANTILLRLKCSAGREPGSAQAHSMYTSPKLDSEFSLYPCVRYTVQKLPMAKEEYWLKRSVIRTNGAPLGKCNDADRLYYQDPRCHHALVPHFLAGYRINMESRMLFKNLWLERFRKCNLMTLTGCTINILFHHHALVA